MQEDVGMISLKCSWNSWTPVKLSGSSGLLGILRKIQEASRFSGNFKSITGAFGGLWGTSDSSRRISTNFGGLQEVSEAFWELHSVSGALERVQGISRYFRRHFRESQRIFSGFQSPFRSVKGYFGGFHWHYGWFKKKGFTISKAVGEWSESFWIRCIACGPRRVRSFPEAF